MKHRAKIVGILILIAYSMLASKEVSPVLGLALELISGAAVIGIAVLMYPLFKQHKLRIPYLSLKSIEGLLMIIAGVFIFLKNILAYDNIYIIHAYVFIVSAFMFYLLLYITQLIPKFISLWGLVATVFLLTGNLLSMFFEMLPIPVMIVCYAPIILNEVFLAIWFIIKGFDIK